MTKVTLPNRENAVDGDSALFDFLEGARGAPLPDVFRLIANLPGLARAFIPMADQVRAAADLDPKLRELAIVAVTARLRSRYENIAHTTMGQRVGLSEAKLTSIFDYETSPHYDEIERAVIGYAIEVTDTATASDKTWDRVRAHLSEAEMMALIVNVAWYNMGARITGPVGLHGDARIEEMAASLGFKPLAY